MGLSAFDSILEHKIGLGKYQYISYTLIGLTQFADGAEVVSLSILLPILKYEWGISDDQQSLLGSVLFLGFFLGSVLGGYISDKYGRRTALLYASAIQFFTGIFSTLITNVNAFIFIRGIFGLIIGFTIPLGAAFASELTPVKYRGRAIVAINSCFSIGSLYAVFVAMFCLDNLQTGNWRAMLIWCSLPALVVWIGTWRFIKESARYLIATERVNEGVEVLNNMALVNNPASYEVISPQEIEGLKEWQRNLFAHQQKTNVTSLFHPKYKKITILMSIMWFSLNFCFYGMTFILPFILSQLENVEHGKSSQGISGLAYTIAGEVPSMIIGMYIIEKEYFGRKKTLIYSSGITFIMFLLAYMVSVSFLIPLLSIARMLLKLNFAIMFPLCTELYPTTCRTAGVGYTAGFGRIGSAIMPFILIDFLKIDVLFPIFVFAIFAAINVLAALQIPYDTTGRHLDLIEPEYEDEVNETKSGEKKLIAMVRL